ncbi:MAG: hypothetical protein HZA51_05115 [Planctomycetes bacterium]|nr:hypothetical protein [Planctomycetota bacterium]
MSNYAGPTGVALFFVAAHFAGGAANHAPPPAKVQVSVSADDITVSELASFLNVTTTKYNISVPKPTHFVFSREVWVRGKLVSEQQIGWLGVEKNKATIGILEKLTDRAAKWRISLDSGRASIGSEFDQLMDVNTLSASALWRNQHVDLNENVPVPLQATFLGKDGVTCPPESARKEKLKSCAQACDEAVILYVKSVEDQ